MRTAISGGRAPARPRFPTLLLTALAAAGAAPAALSAPRLTVAQPSFDFGRISRGEKLEHSFGVHNSGTARLEFTGARLSMPGMTCRISPPIAPGADGTITIEWKTDRVQGAVEGIAEIATNDPAAPSVALTLHGRIEGPLEIEPLPAVFLATFRGEDAARVLTLRIHTDSRSTLRLTGESGTHFRAALEALGERTWRLTVRPAPEAPPGRYDETLTISSADPAIGRVRIPVHLFVKPDLYANPDEIDFGTVSIARLRAHPEGLPFVSQTFFLKKKEGKFRILRLSATDPDIVLGADPPAGSADSFQIEARLRAGALRPGDLSGTISIETDDPSFRIVQVRVQGSLAP